MALTRITKGVIKPNENYDTHNIVSTGIVTSVGLDVNGSADISGSLSVGGVLTYEDVTSIDSVGLITARSGIVVSAGSSVGIGTTNPQQELHLSGSGGGRNTIRIDSDGTALSFHNHSEFMGFIGNDSGKLFINAGGTEDTLSLRTNGASRIQILSTGNVGIGTTIPGNDRLRVHMDGTNKVLQRWGGSLGSTAGQRFLTLFSPATDDINNYYRFHTANALKFVVDAQTDTFCIDQNGRVGIGTDIPGQPLEISDDDPAIRLTDTNSTAGAGTTSYTQIANLNGNTYVYTRANENNGSYLIGGHANGVFDEQVRILPSGGVGINTTILPYGNFSVDHGQYGLTRISNHSHLLLQNKNAGTTDFWSLIPRDNARFGIGRGTPDANGTVHESDEKLTILSDGKTGIGTHVPAYGFDVRVDSFAKAQFKGKGASETNIPFYIMSGNSAVQLGIEPSGGQEKIILQANDDSMRFHTADEERLRISNIGHVAIGTNFPNTSLPLTIAGQYPGIQFQDNQGTSAFNINADSNEFRIQTGVAGGSPSPRLVVNSTGSVLPGADNDQDLGSSSKRWANIYTADLQLSNEGSTNNVDGTWGQYTIQEGEADLFLINRRNGKKYKFMLEEVN